MANDARYFPTLFLAIRPRTLPAAAAPVVAGSALAATQASIHLDRALAALLVALALQIGCNLANDAFDSLSGVDTVERLGPPRAAQLGLLSPQQLLAASAASLSLAAFAGLYLVWWLGWPLLVGGGLAILAALAYSGGPWPYGARALGELAVLLFFGLFAVVGSVYIQTEQLDAASTCLGIALGSLASAILVVNNLRDRLSDQQAGKYTLAYYLGERASRWEYYTCLAIAYATALLALIQGWWPLGSSVLFLSLPLALSASLGVARENGRALNPLLGRTAQLELLYSLLFSIGLYI